MLALVLFWFLLWLAETIDLSAPGRRKIRGCQVHPAEGYLYTGTYGQAQIRVE